MIFCLIILTYDCKNMTVWRSFPNACSARQCVDCVHSGCSKSAVDEHSQSYNVSASR